MTRLCALSISLLLGTILSSGCGSETEAPAPARPSAIAPPMPLPPPVTMAALPSSVPMSVRPGELERLDAAEAFSLVMEVFTVDANFAAWADAMRYYAAVHLAHAAADAGDRKVVSILALEGRAGMRRVGRPRGGRVSPTRRASGVRPDGPLHALIPPLPSPPASSNGRLSR